MALWSALTMCTDIFSANTADAGDEAVALAAPEKGQDHVFFFYHTLSEEQRKAFDDVFDRLPIDEIENGFADTMAAKENLLALALSLERPNVLYWNVKNSPDCTYGANVTLVRQVPERRANFWKATGLDHLHKCRVAVVILSGGMDMPFVEGLPIPVMDIGLLSHKSIYQLYIERLRRLQHLSRRRSGSGESGSIPVYVMCNIVNRDTIETFFRENKFFGMEEQDVLFFTQRNLPTLDINGKILLAEKHRIAMHPDGSGGVFKALVDTGMVADMKSRGVCMLHVCSDRNVACKVADPLFLGFCDSCRVEAGMKSVERIFPEEELGIFCNRGMHVYEDVNNDGKVDAVATRFKSTVIEPEDLIDDVRRKRALSLASAAPPLYFSHGNLSEYFFKLDFVMRFALSHNKHWHIKRKAVACIDLETGCEKPPDDELNGYLLEHRVFDAFDYTKSVACLEMPRRDMAFVKNLTGEHSPQTAVAAVGCLHQEWIKAANGEFHCNTTARDFSSEKCEISPLVSYEGEDLQDQFPVPILLPFYLPSFQESQAVSSATSALTRRRSLHCLDQDSPYAQSLLANEVVARLAGARMLIENPEVVAYEGERVESTDQLGEALPRTPRSKDKIQFSNSESESGESSDTDGNETADPDFSRAKSEKKEERKEQRSGMEFIEDTSQRRQKKKGKNKTYLDSLRSKREVFWGNAAGKGKGKGKGKDKGTSDPSPSSMPMAAAATFKHALSAPEGVDDGAG